MVSAASWCLDCTSPLFQLHWEFADVLHRFIAYIGIAYHLPGSFTGERANLLTSHLKAMGLKDSARIV